MSDLKYGKKTVQLLYLLCETLWLFFTTEFRRVEHGVTQFFYFLLQLPIKQTEYHPQKAFS